ncbi:MAG: NAD(+)/NADH kinase [Gemmatimonadaceae bacterium]
MIRLGVIGHRGYPELPAILMSLLAAARGADAELYAEPDLFDLAHGARKLESPDDIDFVISLGGDGTLLRAVRFLAGAQVPILGVNLGRLGFLTACGPSEVEAAVQVLASGKYTVDERMALRGEAVHADRAQADVHGGVHHVGRWHALNEFVMHKGGFARVLTVRVTVDGEMLGVYTADGIVVASPTGSTAYSLSAGGPLISPSLDSIIITPVSAHTLAIRPIVVPPNVEVMLEAIEGPDEVLVTVDGQAGARFGRGDRLMVRRGSQPVCIVRLPGDSFFDRLRVKLGWGGLPARDEPRKC